MERGGRRPPLHRWLFQAGVGVAEAVAGGAVEGFTVSGIGDGDHQSGALGERLAQEVDGSVLGHYIVGLESRGHYSGAGGEYGLDLAYALAGG